MSEVLFDDRAGYRTAFLQCLSLAERYFWVCDLDLSQTPLEQPESIALLRGFLAGGAGREVRLLIADPRHLEAHSPRLLRVLGEFGQRIPTRVGAQTHRHGFEQAFCLADDDKLVLRFHVDRPRGKACAGDGSAAAPLANRFAQMWESAAPGPSGAPLGI